MRIFEIIPGLYQSSKIDDLGMISGRGIKVVIDLEGGFDLKWLAFFIHSYLYWHIFDLPWLPNRENLWNTARYGFNCFKNDQKVLVHCTQGKNRSSLVNGCILWLNGMGGEEIVKLIQEKVDGALTNWAFKNFIMELKKEGGDKVCSFQYGLT